MNIVDLAILKKMVAGGGGSGTDNYNDLLNLPQINGETLAGNKTAENLGLQDALTFDSAPTEDSTNPVESGGVFNALAGKQDNLTFDDDPTENSTNPVKSGGVYSALAGKQDNLTFDGVYNASTNKAATESTVTNAIAGLDVSAFSVDADETISSISETDGKVSVTKQDITIASNQVAAMTGYAKPSSAPSNPAIQTSDTANQAFGKLEFKADTNQSNILYAIQNGVKNWFDVAAEGNSQYGLSTYSADTETGTVNVASTTSSGSWARYRVPVTLPAGTYTISGNVTNIVGYLDITGNTNVDDQGTVIISRITRGSTGNFSSEFTINSETSFYVAFYANYSGTAQNRSATVTHMMISPKSVYDQDSSYMPPALPNYDLTYIEAQDRAALAEVVDSGAKNLANIPDGTITNVSGATITASKGILTISGTATVDAWITLTTIPNLSGTYTLSGVQATTTENQYFLRVEQGSNAVNDFGNSGTANFNGNGTLYLRIKSGYAFGSGTIIKPMICTKAAFGVSNKFVPYRPNYDLVCQSLSYVITKLIATSTDYTLISALPIVLTKIGIYRISVFQDYSYTNPRGIIISRSNSDYTESLYVLAKSETSSDVASLSTSCLFYQSTTNVTNLYFWAKAKTVTSNQMGVIIEYLG